MRSARHFIIEAKSTHKEKIGSIIIENRFENQHKVNQFQPIVAVPKRYKDKIKVGELLCVHFNTLRFEKNNAGKKLSRNHIKDDYYSIPESEAHFVVRKDGSIYFLRDECIVEGKLGREEITTKAGIFLPDTRNEYDKKKELLYGDVWAVSDKVDEFKVGDKLCMEAHSDYQIEFPDGKVRWLVKYNYIIFKYE